MMLLINIDLFIYAYFSEYNMEKFIYASWNLDEGWWVFRISLWTHVAYFLYALGCFLVFFPFNKICAFTYQEKRGGLLQRS